MAVDSRRVIAGASGSLRSLGALRAGVSAARPSGSTLLALLAWAPAGGELAHRRAPCPFLLRIWEQDAQERLRGTFDAVFGGIPGDARTALLLGSRGPRVRIPHPDTAIPTPPSRPGQSVVEALEVLAAGIQGVVSVGSVEYYFGQFFDFVGQDNRASWRALSTLRAWWKYSAMCSDCTRFGHPADNQVVIGQPLGRHGGRRGHEVEAAVALAMMRERYRFDEQTEEAEPSRQI